MRKLTIILFVLIFSSITSYSQDTVYVDGYYATGGTYGTLNDAVDAAIAAGTINNTVFKLSHYDIYVLSRSIYIDHGQSLEIVADKPGTTQETAPPQIVWTEEEIDRDHVIQSYGDIVMKNIWVRAADILGGKVNSSITFENQEEAEDPEVGNFDGCIFDYCGIGAESGGTILVKADHFEGEFQNCYWRNNSDDHFRYYGRAVSFPWQSTDWHYDKLLFENCSFSNLGRIVMQEGGLYGSNIHINHCTMINSVEWVWQSGGLLETASITNSIFINPNMIGYRALDLLNDDQDYDDFLDGLADPPGGGLINGITEVDSFNIEVEFTDEDRKLFVGNNVYMYHDWMVDWYQSCPWAQNNTQQRHPEENYHPSPMIGEEAMDFIDSVDAEGNKYFIKLNVDTLTIYVDDPEFVVEPTSQDTLMLFMEAKWNDNSDYNWSFEPDAGRLQTWPLPENMAYANAMYQTAAMGGFPLGDLNWYPDQMPAWEAQKEDEWQTINNWLNYGDPTVGVKEIAAAIPTEYQLNQNFPNPFNPTTQIEYSIPEQGNVSLKVFNSLGQEVATLFDGMQTAGIYSATFNASSLSSGVYFYTLKSNGIVLTKKLMLIK